MDKISEEKTTNGNEAKTISVTKTKKRRLFKISSDASVPPGTRTGDSFRSIAISPDIDSGAGGISDKGGESNDHNDELDFIAPKYNENERVYACDSGEVYLATIKRSKYQALTKQWKYFVHYHGWNARHDRWLNEDCLLPDNDESRQMAKKSTLKTAELEKERKTKKARLEKEKKGRKERKQRGNNNAKKKKNEESDLDNKIRAIEISCTLPFDLQKVLVEDQFQITKLGRYTSQGYDRVSTDSDTRPARMVHDLPSAISVERLLKYFAKTSIKSKSKHISKDGTKLPSSANENGDTEEVGKQYNSFTSEMINLFNAMLPKYLLYNFEHAQFLKLCVGKQSRQDSSDDGKKIAASKIYGGEYLLRMLVRLPIIMSTIKKIESSCREGNRERVIFSAMQLGRALDANGETVGQLLSELVTFLSKNKNKIFKGEYRGPSLDEYTESEKRCSEKQASRQNKLKNP